MRADYVLEKQVDLILAALMPANRLVIRVAVHTGLRVGDVLNLRTEQLSHQLWVT